MVLPSDYPVAQEAISKNYLVSLDTNSGAYLARNTGGTYLFHDVTGGDYSGDYNVWTGAMHMPVVGVASRDAASGKPVHLYYGRDKPVQFYVDSTATPKQRFDVSATVNGYAHTPATGTHYVGTIYRGATSGEMAWGLIENS